MDSHCLFIEVSDSSFSPNKVCDSPNLSSGYCSSEDGPLFGNSWYAKSMPIAGEQWDDGTLSPRSPFQYCGVMAKSEEHATNDFERSVFTCPKNSVFGETMSQFSRHLTAELGDIPDNGIVQQHRKDDGMVHAFESTGLVSRGHQYANATLPTSVVRPLSRTRGGATLASCSALLRHSAHLTPKTLPVKSKSVSIRHCQRVPVSCDALRDHMYAMSPSAVSHDDVAWIKKQSTRGFPCSGNISILEAFLRSTTAKFDANRGSTELAAEELSKLRVSTAAVTKSTVKSNRSKSLAVRDSDSTTFCSSSLLKQLLTGEMGSGEPELEQTRLNEDQLHICMPDYSVDSLLTDGFGLDANLQLDDPLSNGIGLLGANEKLSLDVVSSGSQMVMSCDLDDSLQEQSRQEGLLWQHYSTVL